MEEIDSSGNTIAFRYKRYEEKIATAEAAETVENAAEEATDAAEDAAEGGEEAEEKKD